MAHTRRTLTLDKSTWDLTLDASGRIAVTGGPLATAQNAANECRLFTNDAYFTQARGLPHFLIELGQRVNAALLRSWLRRAALTVEDVAEVQSVEITDIDPDTRKLSGYIQFTTVEESDGQLRTDI